MDTKYVVCFTIPNKFENIILSKGFKDKSGHGLHVSLYMCYSDTTNQKYLIKNLNSIHTKPFSLEIDAYEELNSDALVLKVNRSDEILNLHTQIVNKIKKFASLTRTTKSQQYLFEKFNPHITIGSIELDSDKKRGELLNLEIPLTQFSLHKKENNAWTKVHTFNL